MTLREELISSLIAAGIPSPRLETDIILKHAAPTYPEVTSKQEQVARMMLHRRCQGEPMDKIVGQREFYKSVFKVNQNVLSPRPDTEILVESALSLIPENKSCRILDLGTGSGCVILSLLKERPLCRGTAVDISPLALQIAKDNAETLGLSPRIEFILSSWTAESFPISEYDMVVSNPPYIPSEDINALSTEVKDYDPRLALDGGADGLRCYREIAGIAPLILKKGGYILLEAGIGQENDIAGIFSAHDLTCVKIVPDLAGVNRCVILKK